MRKTIPTLAVLLAAAATAAVPTASASAPVASLQAHTERFSFIDTSVHSPQPVFSVVATGAFTDGGTAAQKGSNGLVLKLSAGTITFRTATHVSRTSKSETVSVCVQTQAKHGSYTIVGGTGASRGITGSGHSVMGATFVERLVHGACANGFSAVQAVVTASGPVALP